MVYHVVNKSIAGFEIFNNDNEYLRMMMTILYYQCDNLKVGLADFLRSKKIKDIHTFDKVLSVLKNENLVNIIAYCFMPTHLHLILEQLKKDGILRYMSNILNSYARYFNVKYRRKGPLWEGHFKKISIKTDEVLLHITRYIHLNPVTAHIVDKPEEWPYSSYKEYISMTPHDGRICKYEEFLDIRPEEYKKFCEDQISYQRELAKIKKLTLE